MVPLYETIYDRTKQLSQRTYAAVGMLGVLPTAA
jgi:hypothetical protein